MTDKAKLNLIKEIVENCLDAGKDEVAYFQATLEAIYFITDLNEGKNDGQTDK